jgi:hypothetical protein
MVSKVLTSCIQMHFGLAKAHLNFAGGYGRPLVGYWSEDTCGLGHIEHGQVYVTFPLWNTFADRPDGSGVFSRSI